MAQELFKKKLSREEKIYIEAVKLQGAIPCILRFEQKVSSLKSAAKKFESLGDYKDAAVRKEECRKQAVAIRKKGLADTYASALEKKEAAKTKSEYADAIVEFQRVVKREAYRDKAKEQIRLCKKEIIRLETRAAWKRRLTALAVLAVCVALFVVTPVYPFAKGLICQQKGNYEEALENYKEADALPWTKDLKAVCYYNLGMEKLEQGKQSEAVFLLKKAKGNKAAKKQLKKLEEEYVK